VRRLTIRTRLVLAYTSIVAVAVLLLGSVAFVTARLALDAAFQTRLDTTARAIRSIVDIRHGRLEDLEREDLLQFQALLGQGLNAAVLRADRSMMSSNLSPPPTALLTSVVASAAPTAGIARIDRGSSVYDVLRITDGGPVLGTIVAWESRDVYDDVERIILLALAAAGIVVIAAAIAAGGTLTTHTLRPVTELSAMISDIEATDLGERLVWDGPDDELGRLCNTFDRLLDRLETAFERERRFIADASHELRTPLSVMRAEVELALMHDRTPDSYRSALQRLQRETQRLEALAQSLILTSRDHADRVTMVAVATADVVERAVARMQPLALSRGIALTGTSSTSVEVRADGDMLERAIVTLIDNALRFARSMVAIDVSFDGTNAAIAVRDDGPGFSDAALREATSRFWRDDPARSGEGTGLGLAIARTIIERHGGSIELRNSPAGAGAVVVLTLPAAAAIIP
jgi:two-component system, OmpR family, sensor kinase